jgi:hypothetical protein
MALLKNKLFYQILLLALSVSLIIAGVMMKEIPEVISNAKTLCFWCIGLK